MKTGAQTSSTDRNKLKRNTDPKSHSYDNISSSTYHIKKKLVPERDCIRFNSFRRTLELTEIEERLQALENAQLMGLAHYTIIADGALINILIDLLQNTDNLTSVIQNRRI